MSYVIIVDDDPASLRMAQTMVAQLDWEYVGTSNGAEALAEAQRRKPDLFLSDTNMPGMGGIELLKIVESDENFRGIPVILMSGENREIEARENGAAAFIQKPFRLEDLRA